MSAKVLLKRSVSPFVWGCAKICETMINVTQVDERGNKSGSKDGSTICDNYSRSSMPEDNFFKLLSICFHEQTLEISQGDQFQCDGKELIAGGDGTKRPGGR
ncbi:hypothetical protein TNCV_1950301 [Trichonephila clavipes]|nr:hypothetical protein TNCV_1950301 [Trichonephila clavipes]